MGIQGNDNSFFTCYLKVVLDRFFENLKSVLDDSISHYCPLLFCIKSSSLDFFGHAGNWLKNKTMDNFKVYHITDWETSNYNTHITQYLKK